MENLLTSITLKQLAEGTLEAEVNEIQTSSSKAVVIERKKGAISLNQLVPKAPLKCSK